MQVFENAVFFVFQNPFHAGDTINFDGSRYDVKSVTLQKVHLTRVDGAAVTVMTSHFLRVSSIHNISRSAPLWEGIHVLVDMETPMTALHCIAYKVQAAMKLQPRLFGGSYRVWFEGLVSSYKKEIVLWFDHAGPGVSWSIPSPSLV